MRRAKVISSTTSNYVEDNVDKWLLKNKNAEIVSVKNKIREDNGSTLTTIIYDIKNNNEKDLLP